MKKDYLKPFIRMVEAETEDMIALSMLNGTADDSDALSREQDNWSDRKGRGVWDDEWE